MPKLYDPVTEVSVYIDGHHMRGLDTDEFCARLRELFAEYGADGDSFIVIQEREV